MLCRSPPVDSLGIELAQVFFELRPPLWETAKDAEVRTSLEGAHVQEHIASFDVFRPPRLVEVQFLPLVVAGQDARREVIALRVKVMSRGKPPGLNGQGIVVAK